jgi:hypothetical protein
LLNRVTEGRSILKQPLDVDIRTANLSAQDVQLGDVISLQEVKLSAVNINIRPAAGLSIHVQDANATLVVTEANLNKLLASNPPDGTRDLEIATLSGRLRISGKNVWNRIPIPFVLTGAPEIDGGARLRINVHQIQILGPISLPSLITQGIGTRLNDSLAEKFDISKLPWKIRLTGLTVEPGRILLSANTSIELSTSLPGQQGADALDKP